jgi:hypothetical protein
MEVLLLQQYVGRLMVLFHALGELRNYIGGAARQKPWMLELERSGVAFAKRWGMASSQVAQAILTIFFDLVERYHGDSQSVATPGADQNRPPSLLIAASDWFYKSMLLGVSSALVCWFTVFVQFQMRDPIFLYTAQATMSRLIDILESLAVGPEHPAHRAAAVARELQRVWQERAASRVTVAQPTPAAGSQHTANIRRSDKGLSALLLEEHRQQEEERRRADATTFSRTSRRTAPAVAPSPADSASGSASSTAYSPDLSSTHSWANSPLTLPISAERGSAMSGGEPPSPVPGLVTSSPSVGDVTPYANSLGGLDLFDNQQFFGTNPSLFEYGLQGDSATEFGMSNEMLQAMMDPALADDGFWNFFVGSIDPLPPSAG